MRRSYEPLPNGQRDVHQREYATRATIAIISDVQLHVRAYI